ncbi:Condensin complex subunit 2 [Halotydeus destructor]|nr:Condensin complex subunit 2 [Halotydeus destructor]
MTKRNRSPDENLSDNLPLAMDRKRRAAKLTKRVEQVFDSDDSFVSEPNRHNKSDHRESIATPRNFNDVIPAKNRNATVMLEKETVESLMAKRKSLILNSASVVKTTRNDDDEEAEKLRRHRQRASAIKRQSLVAPMTPTTSASSRKSVAPSPAFADATSLKTHYANCIKMAHSNKINVKNAFGFYIIDYMSAMLKSNEMNFTLATNTLDAGTKIYINRVDAVYQEAQKVLNGIVLASDNKGSSKDKETELDNEDEENEEGGDGADEAPKAKRKKVRKPGKTLATAESLNVTKLETNAEIDPVLYRLTTAHDMGNVNGLFLANLRRNIRGELILDSNAVLNNVQSLEATKSFVPFDPFISQLEKIKDSDMKICPKLSAFVFSNREEGLGIDVAGDEADETAQSKKPSEFTFDLDAEIPEEDICPPTMDPFDDMEVGGFDDADSDSFSDGGDRPRVTQKSVIRALNLESLPDLNRILSEKPDDYTYFNKKIIAAWAGPEYWRANNLWQRLHRSKKNIVPADASNKRERKKYEELDFRLPLEDHAGKRALAKTLKLQIKTLEKWAAAPLVLPEKHQQDLGFLLRPSLKTNQLFRCVAAKESRRRVPADGGLGDVTDDDDDMGRCGTGFDAPTSPMPMMDVDDAEFGFGTQTQTTTQPNTALFEAFTGDNLIDQPFTVEQINLPYAKFAKKIDVKTLKRVISDIIDEAPSSSQETLATGDIASQPETKLTFTTLYSELPKHRRVTAQMSQNISAPIAFVTLLHLANEQNLVLENQKDFRDIIIYREPTET